MVKSIQLWYVWLILAAFQCIWIAQSPPLAHLLPKFVGILMLKFSCEATVGTELEA